MVSSADLRDGNDFALGRRFNAPRRGRVAIKGQVRPRVVIVIKVGSQDSLQVDLVQNDHVIKTLPAYGTNHPFAIRVLSGRPWCGQDFLDTHILDSLLEVVAVDAIAIADQKT